MDIDLPGIDGIEAMHRIHRLAPEKTPIIAMTAHVMTGDTERFISAGMDGVLTKPFEIEKLRSVLIKYAVPNAPETPEILSVAYDSKAVAETIGIPEDRLMELVDLFLNKLSVDYSRSLKEAIEANDYPKIRAAAHKFRGAALNLRLDSCSKILTEIETAAENSLPIGYKELFGKLEKEMDELRNVL